jgi:hypothetical protein
MHEIAGVNGPQPGQPQAFMQPPPAPARASLCFMRTELGNQQVRRSQTMLPLHIARLLLLFEGPQTVADLRQMIDEPWLPEALIELERRRLIQRVTPVMAPSQNLLANAMQVRHAAAGDASLAQRRGRTRMMFLRQLGTLGTDMARRIDQCQSGQELDELMPQVDALIEAIAGHEALGHFRQQTTRSS